MSPAATPPAATPNGATVVITGASAGVGRATAHAFARNGARIGLIARDRNALEDTRAEVERLGGEGLVLPLDVADPKAVEEAAGRTEDVFGPIDVWVNNAMVTVFSPVRDLRAEELHRVTKVTYFGYVHGTIAALRRMMPRDRGTIVQVGSALAYRAIPLQAAYCGAKHAIVGFTDSLRAELIHDRSRVRLTAVHLPAMNTPQFDWARTKFNHRPKPVGPIMQPEHAADAILYAARHAPRELWVGHTTAQTVLGQFVAPALLDRMLANRAWRGQMRGQPLPPDYRDNLFDPVPGLHAVHGAFNRDASLPGFSATSSVVRGVAAGVAFAVMGALALGAAAMARR